MNYYLQIDFIIYINNIMALISNNNLCGCSISSNSLSGTNYMNINSSQQNIAKQFHFKLLNDMIIPLLHKQWDKLNENMLIIDSFKSKLTKYYNQYKTDDLLLLKSLLDTFEIILAEHKQLSTYEEQVNSLNQNGSPVASFTRKVTSLKLKPEYEIYNYIFGKPNIKNNEKYDNTIIMNIEGLLQNENLNFKDIVNYIKQKYIKI